MRVVLTCEHATSSVPPRYRALFAGQEAILSTHRGVDIGANTLAKTMARHFDAPLFVATTSRLLVETNRTLGQKGVFSEFTAALATTEKEELVRRYYVPHRQGAEDCVGRFIAEGHLVVHIGVHTFTPVLRGTTRTAEVGLLFDPRRPLERDLCRSWQESLRQADAKLRVRRNYPYLGKADGFTTYLRKRFSPSDYIGIELEVNQAFPLGARRPWQALQTALCVTLEASLNSLRPRASRRGQRTS